MLNKCMGCSEVVEPYVTMHDGKKWEHIPRNWSQLQLVHRNLVRNYVLCEVCTARVEDALAFAQEE